MPKPQRKYLRVTEVIDFVNASWYQYWVKSVGSVEECERITRESSAFGTGVHKMVENYLIGSPLPELSERQKACGSLLVNWCKETQAKPLTINDSPAVECTLQCERYGYEGHPDLLCTFGEDTTPWIIDWKTSKEFKLGYYLQAAAYAHAARIEHGITIKDGAILRVEKDPNKKVQFEVIEMHDLEEKYFPIFLAALDVVNFFKKRDKWKVKRGE